MTPLQREVLRIKFKRFRTLRTANPICVTCGERRWWVPYELHHIAGRKHSDIVIRLCSNCHYGINIMQTLLPKLDETANPQLVRLIALLEGHQVLMDCAAASLGETVAFLRGVADKRQAEEDRQ